MPVLLVIDDDPLILHVFRRLFEETDVKLLTEETAAAGMLAMERDRPDVVILDVMLPDLSGLEAFRQVHQIDAKVPVIFITAGGASDTAIEAMKLGAYDYLLKPLDFKQVREVVGKAFEISRSMHTPVDLTGGTEALETSADVLVGRCQGIQTVYKEIGRAAPQDVMVLVRGESGTGKELVARAIYHHSRRSEGPFLAINCAAIPENLLESELFGHEKGAFTGADQQRIGKFEQCTGGTLFMDEIGDMTPSTQSKILRLLEDQAFERVGGTETIKTDVRIIAATNRNLEEMVENSQFRGDLFFRLNVFNIALPPLRDRADDILLLLEHFLARFNRDLNKDVQGISPDALEMLTEYHWPGNVRELQSVLKQALLRANGPLLVADFFPEYIIQAGQLGTPGIDQDRHTVSNLGQFIRTQLETHSENLYAQTQELMERTLLTEVLRHTEGNQLQAAKILGITRGTLRTKIRALGISINRVVLPERESTSLASTDPAADPTS